MSYDRRPAKRCRDCGTEIEHRKNLCATCRARISEQRRLVINAYQRERKRRRNTPYWQAWRENEPHEIRQSS